MAHALFMPENYDKNKAALRICNGYCSSTVTMVRQTPLSVKLYVYFLFCWGVSMSIPLMRVKHLKPYVCCNSTELCNLLAGFLCVFYVVRTSTDTVLLRKLNYLFS
jgi:hypothetical protein